MNHRLKALHAVQPPYDMANPPEGVRLRFAQVAIRLKVSVSDMVPCASLDDSM